MTKKQFDGILSGLTKSKVTVISKNGGVYTVFKVSISDYDGISFHTNFGLFWYDDVAYLTEDKVNVIDTSLTFGSDPEFFFKKDGVIIPSTMILNHTTTEISEGSVVPDGFQGELNPDSSYCRALAGRSVGQAVVDAYNFAKKAGAELCFDVATIIEEPVWKKSDRSLKRYGCNPTENVHESRFKRVTGMRERFRACGGHIHIGGIAPKEKNNEDTVVKLVTLMDIIAGNTCVLIDRDENNARRRKNYGRAGEYRLKKYGLEYRVLSNFWLKHYVLWSMVSGLVANAVGIYRKGLADELIGKFNLTKVRKAINNNDKDLAYENFLILAEFIRDKKIMSDRGVSLMNLDNFERWIKNHEPLSLLKVKTDEDIVKKWRERSRNWMAGFEEFISKV
jgi:Phage phiEco32-like COOH.NH2 ligase-type 2